MQEMLQKLKDSYNHLSAGQKKVAKLFFEEPSVIAFSSALEAGRHVNVSESTVIRLTQKIGYKGYTEVQHMIQRKLAEERWLSGQPESSLSEEQTFLHNLLDADINNISALKKTLKEEALHRVVEHISRARKVYVTSNLFSYGLGHLFTQWLNMVLDNTEMLIQGDTQYYQQLSKLGQDDVVIVLAFPRYSKNIIETVKTAKHLGATVISVSDKQDSPVAAYSTILLEVDVNTNLNIDSYTAAVSLLTSIVRFVSVKEHEKVTKNLKRVEKMYQEKQIFYEEGPKQE
ncbi:MurR/RpiR family transcriptional regulator [Jeotgalibacillus proteolyticus]|uniref:MurR/RpiR family transcriptional regulator n=1 Tax=Jeotgalibacillus proteolyticus TaxID=2082395 RepID=A0A2S5GDC1_9BACL|nr:MurR/RpiR family transcriptional regulator [Jeotgalibacillus proteolyticus]PPA70893.1 MurR/RpiR family transcriptional regulator [Jeotgalibacillus proteolyticus]